jgi:hypothetical protein
LSLRDRYARTHVQHIGTDPVRVSGTAGVDRFTACIGESRDARRRRRDGASGGEQQVADQRRAAATRLEMQRGRIRPFGRSTVARGREHRIDAATSPRRVVGLWASGGDLSRWHRACEKRNLGPLYHPVK